jgi:hypothetical protein
MNVRHVPSHHFEQICPTFGGYENEIGGYASP